MKRLLVAAVVALTMTAAGAHTAHATEYCYRGGCKYEKVVKYVPVITYEKHTEAYTTYVTCYDHCGKPYLSPKTCYRTVEVPVKTIQTVVCYVKVCY